MEKICTTTEETYMFAEELLQALRERQGGAAVVLALCGELGVGKTALTKDIAKLLGVQQEVTSPTFVLRNDYETDDTMFTKLHHIDAYRLTDGDANDTIGLRSLLRKANTLIIIEWPDRLNDPLPEGTITVNASVAGTTHSFTTSDI